LPPFEPGARSFESIARICGSCRPFVGDGRAGLGNARGRPDLLAASGRPGGEERSFLTGSPVANAAGAVGAAAGDEL